MIKGQMSPYQGLWLQESVNDQMGREPVSPLSALLAVVRNMFPENIALAAVNMNILGIITFSLMFGLALASIGEAADSMVRAVDVSPSSQISIP